MLVRCTRGTSHYVSWPLAYHTFAVCSCSFPTLLFPFILSPALACSRILFVASTARQQTVGLPMLFLLFSLIALHVRAQGPCCESGSSYQYNSGNCVCKGCPPGYTCAAVNHGQAYSCPAGDYVSSFSTCQQCRAGTWSLPATPVIEGCMTCACFPLPRCLFCR